MEHKKYCSYGKEFIIRNKNWKEITITWWCNCKKNNY